MRTVIATHFILLLALYPAFSDESARTWTNTEGKSVSGALVGIRGDHVELAVGGKNYTFPITTLSEADREYLKDYAEKNKPKTGTFAMQLCAKMFPQSEEYFNTIIGKASREAYSDRGLDPLSLVAFPSEDEKAQVYVPQHYDGSASFGVYINISAGNGPACPKNYYSIMDKNDMILASPHKAGNNEETSRRVALALDTLASIEKIYKIDKERVYIGGISGGGITALQAQIMYPDIWQGVLSHARGMNLGNFGAYYSETKSFSKSEFERVSGMKQRIAILSGPKDFNYNHCKETVAEWKDHGWDIQFFETGGGHSMAPPESFETALEWVMGK